MDLYIKNMVCGRCIKVVNEELVKLGLTPESIDLGIVKLKEDQIAPDQQAKLNDALHSLGFEILDSSKTRLIEQIKGTIINKIFYSEVSGDKINWSKLISDACFHEYNYLSSLFSSVEGVTIEQYIIRQKIERVKELLFYDELNLSEIANKLDYSSVAHLSAQFKKITGQTPSQFKKERANHKRKPLDHIF